MTQSSTPASGKAKPAQSSTNARLVSVASDLFYRRGVQAVGVDEIAAEAGVTKMTLYRHFTSKDLLVATCLEAAAQNDLAAFDEIAQRYAGEPAEQLRAILAAVAAKIASPGYRGWSATNIVMELTDAAHPARKVAETAKTLTRARILDLAVSAKALRPQSLADGLMLLIEGAAASRHAFADGGPATSLVEIGGELLTVHGVT